MITRYTSGRAPVLEMVIYYDSLVTVKVLVHRDILPELIITDDKINDTGAYYLLETVTTPLPRANFNFAKSDHPNVDYIDNLEIVRGEYIWTSVAITKETGYVEYRLWVDTQSVLRATADSKKYCIDSKGLVLYVEYNVPVHQGITFGHTDDSSHPLEFTKLNMIGELV